MYQQRKPRRFKHRSNGRGHQQRSNGIGQSRHRSNIYSNDHLRNNFRSTQNAAQLFDKYNALAKEALSSGDKTLSENYLQHADHFARIMIDKNNSEKRDKVENKEKIISDVKSPTENADANLNQNIEEKKE